jgi:amino acid transporter/mannitol/fructose-specific phosphotransferase system IIA component (Ntr-type)
MTLDKSKRLKQDLGLFKVYALATGATLSSGFFLLPGLATAQAGPAVTLSYVIAALHLIPAVFCMAELATAMPRAGGIYYFVDRSMGPLFGTIAGIGTWFALILKTAFALVGMGAYIGLFFPELPVVPVAVLFAVGFGWLNLLGAKKSAGLQVILVMVLLAVLSWFMGYGFFELKAAHFSDYFASGFSSIYATAGLVYISYVGLTNIASVSEEVKNPERNLPLGMFLALVTAILIYTLGTVVMTGIIPPDVFHGNLTPVASAAKILGGSWGATVMTLAAILAFFSVSNAAILSASRYPLAMSRDHLFPRFFRILSSHRTPTVAILSTVTMILLCLVLLNPAKIAKLASAFQLLLFAMSCLAVIIMRESRIPSYDPGYRSPFYPWLHLAGIISPLFLIVEMGTYPSLFTLALISIGVVWFFAYAKDKVRRDGAIYHYLARLGENRFEGLDRELRGILKEKGLRAEDPFDVIIAKAQLIDFDRPVTFEEVVKRAAISLAKHLPVPAEILQESFMQGTRVGATPVSHGAALPHMRLPDLEHSKVAIVRSRTGVDADIDDEYLGPRASDEPVYAFFFLVSPEENPGMHLRLLAQIAQQMDSADFIKNWLKAINEQEMKELLLRHDRTLSLIISADNQTTELIDTTIRDLHLPAGSLIALIHRHGDIIVPRGSTTLQEGDQLTIISDPHGIKTLANRYRV